MASLMGARNGVNWSLKSVMFVFATVLCCYGARCSVSGAREFDRVQYEPLSCHVRMFRYRVGKIDVTYRFISPP